MIRDTRIFVTWTAPGFHHWPGAPDERDYLGIRHRHLFHYRIELDVLHDERDIEFHDLLDIGKTSTRDAEWNGMSCEAIARALLFIVEHHCPGRHASVTVSEDGECGATVRSPSHGSHRSLS